MCIFPTTYLVFSESLVNATEIARTEIADALSVPVDSITSIALTCPNGATGVIGSWTQTCDGIVDTTVKKVVDEVKNYKKKTILHFAEY